jgi:hypothetical protein
MIGCLRALGAAAFSLTLTLWLGVKEAQRDWDGTEEPETVENDE